MRQQCEAVGGSSVRNKCIVGGKKLVGKTSWGSVLRKMTHASHAFIENGLPWRKTVFKNGIPPRKTVHKTISTFIGHFGLHALKMHQRRFVYNDNCTSINYQSSFVGIP